MIALQPVVIAADNAELFTAVVTLFGVVVGGVLAVVVDALRQRRADNRLRKAAGLLLADEFDQTSQALTRAADSSIATPSMLPGRLPSWEAYREILAVTMETDGWIGIARAVGEARQ